MIPASEAFVKMLMRASDSLGESVDKATIIGNSLTTIANAGNGTTAADQRRVLNEAAQSDDDDPAETN